MKIDVLSLFPEMIEAVLDTSILGRAIEKNILEVESHNIRDFTLDKHNRVDDTPFGGGAGMLMQAEPVFRCLEFLEADKKKIIYPSPRGEKLSKTKIKELANSDNLLILCGHYEGIDERILDAWPIEEVSIGDYILTGGEPAAIVIIDAIARFLPGVLGSEDSIEDESIYSGLLEHPQYTRPRDFRGRTVPDVLLSGNHRQIALWNFEQSLKLTAERRPDLFYLYMNDEEKISKLDKQEKIILEKQIKEYTMGEGDGCLEKKQNRKND